MRINTVIKNFMNRYVSVVPEPEVFFPSNFFCLKITEDFFFELIFENHKKKI
jgi:hypothetical protein